jgi:1-acyl-sn-glycerol-3-phosphate acyltransferase
MKILDYIWRLFGTVFGFTVFGILGLVMGLLLFPLLFLFYRDPGKRKSAARALIGTAFRSFVWYMKSVGVMDYRIEGAEHIACRPNQLIIANHPTLIDVVILLSLFPQANCVIKSAVTRNIFMRNTVAAADYISNNEPDTLLESCIRYVESGGSLMLFPEGTRTRQGEPIVFEPGAAAVAIRSRAEILPVAIRCEPIFLTRQLAWHYVPPRKPQFKIRVMPPVRVEELVRIGDNERQSRLDLNDKLLNMVSQAIESMDVKQGVARTSLKA